MSAENFQLLYEFERLLSATLESLFNDAELTPVSANTAPAFQKQRGRTEIYVIPGPRFDNHYVIAKQSADDAAGLRRENGWSGTFHLTCITRADFQLHSQYLAATRDLAAQLDQLDLSATKCPLQFHEVLQVKTAGTNSQIKGDDGFYQSQLAYEFIFAIRADAWPFGLLSA